MDCYYKTIAPLGAVYQSVSLSCNPVAMASWIAQLKRCLQPLFYQTLETKTAYFIDKISNATQHLPVHIFHIGSIFWIAFTKEDSIKDAASIVPASMDYFKNLHSYLIDHGIYLGPSGYEVGFISEAHSYEDLDYTATHIIAGINAMF